MEKKERKRGLDRNIRQCLSYVIKKNGPFRWSAIVNFTKEDFLSHIEKEFEGQNYGVFKQKVADSIIKALEPFHKKYNELMENPKYLEEICEKGAKKARELASKTVKNVYEKIGIIR